MKKELSTIDCKKHNEFNAAPIAAGLMEAWEPSDKILLEEKKAKALEESGFKIAKAKLDILKALDPKTDGKHCHGVDVEVVEVVSGSYTSHRVGWRLNVGSGWGATANKGWCKIGDGTTLGMSFKQFEKAKSLIAEIKATEDRRNADVKEQEAHEKRYVAFYSANEKLVKDITDGNAGASWRPKQFLVSEKGYITWNYETYTPEQWQRIVELKQAQRRAMDVLKADFKKLNFPEL